MRLRKARGWRDLPKPMVSEMKKKNTVAGNLLVPAKELSNIDGIHAWTQGPNFGMPMSRHCWRDLYGEKKESKFQSSICWFQRKLCMPFPAFYDTFANWYMFIHFLLATCRPAVRVDTVWNLIDGWAIHTNNKSTRRFHLSSCAFPVLYIFLISTRPSVNSNAVLPDFAGKDIWVPFAKANSFEE